MNVPDLPTPPRLADLSPIDAIKQFLELESASGILLMVATAFAMVAANSMLQPWYDGLLTAPVVIQVGALALDKPLLLWINDGLMAIFFLLVGLEVKREIVDGQLSDPAKVVLPCVAAVGGIVVPSGIYVWFNLGQPTGLEGWAIPAATDIAFALGVLALLGSRVPASLKLFLLVLAIIDDLAAIAIIALFYTGDLSVTSLVLAATALGALVALNLSGVTRGAAYVIVGVILWVCVLKSGVHATLAGVAIAFAVPLRPDRDSGRSVLREMEYQLHPWVAYGILPLFAFANAGITLKGLSIDALLEPIPLGIFAGLFVGKQVGVFLFAAAAILLGLARRPEGASWMQLWGVSVLTGIGFTMSLFISGLAFQHTSNAGGGTDMIADRLGIIAASVASALLGAAVLFLSGGRTAARARDEDQHQDPAHREAGEHA